MGMDRDLFRDDVLQSGLGFYPGDFALPLKLRIFSVFGEGYDGSDICPPRNSTNASAVEFGVAANSFYVTLTTMDELEDLDEDTDLISNAWRVPPAFALLVMVLPRTAAIAGSM